MRTESSQSGLWFTEALLPGGWAQKVRIRTEAGHIVSVETDVDPAAGDERHAIALPGMPNLHSHAFQRVIAGLTERRGASDDSFWSWRDQMYRLQARIGPDELQTIASMAYVEMLEGGFTHVGEFHYLHHTQDGTAFDDPAEMAARIAAAASDTGIGLTLLPVFYAHSGFGGKDPTPGQARFLHDVDGFAKLMDSGRNHVSGLEGGLIGIAPHSLRAVTPDELKAITPLAQGGPVHIHIAEQEKEVADCVNHFVKRPVEWLLGNAPVDGRWCLVHATHMTDAETLDLAASGAVAGLCPITEANLGDGIFPAAAFLEAGGRFGIGSDSNVLISAPEELRFLEYPQRLKHRARNVLGHREGSTGLTLYQGAVSGGAQALGIEGGGIETGLAVRARADIVSLNTRHPALAGKRGDDVIDSLIFAAAGQAIDCVWRYGRKWVSGGRHSRREAIEGDYVALMQRLLS